MTMTEIALHLHDGVCVVQINPEPDWGPKARAGPGADVTLEERRLRGMARKAKRVNKRKPNSTSGASSWRLPMKSSETPSKDSARFSPLLFTK